MPNIKPISELRNYGEVLRYVAIGSPVFLTKNGHVRYAVLDIDEYKEYEKILKLRKELLSAEEDRASGMPGATPDELEGYLDAVISEAEHDAV
jgi:hypothetical protein